MDTCHSYPRNNSDQFGRSHAVLDVWSLRCYCIIIYSFQLFFKALIQQCSILGSPCFSSGRRDSPSFYPSIHRIFRACWQRCNDITSRWLQETSSCRSLSLFEISYFGNLQIICFFFKAYTRTYWDKVLDSLKSSPPFLNFCVEISMR